MAHLALVHHGSQNPNSSLFSPRFEGSDRRRGGGGAVAHEFVCALGAAEWEGWGPVQWLTAVVAS